MKKEYDKNLRHRCYYFAVAVVKFVKELKVDRKYFSIIDQVIRSSASIGANLIESSNSSSRKDFSRYITISLRSANETKYWLCLVRDGFDLKTEELSKLISECDEISKMLGASLLKLRTVKTVEA